MAIMTISYLTVIRSHDRKGAINYYYSVQKFYGNFNNIYQYWFTRETKYLPFT